MSASEPRRWLDQSGELSDLLRQAQDEYGRGLDPHRALLRGEERRKTAPSALKLLVPAMVLAAVLLTLPWLRSSRPGTALDSVHVSPEQWTALASSEKSLLEPPPAAPSATPPRAERGTPRAALADARKNDREQPLEQPPAPAPALGQAPAQPASEPEEDCLAHARAGDARRAAHCFEQRAQGAGLSAQVALYELSRLQRDALGEPVRALTTLEQYLARFPQGSLSGEASFSRVELLAKLGRSTDALEASSELLRSRFGGERAAEVRLLRGNLLLRSLRQPQSAVAEYRAALGAPGRVGDEAAFQLGAALEAAGDVAAARTTYEQYLKRSSARHAAAARARLEALP